MGEDIGIEMAMRAFNHLVSAIFIHFVMHEQGTFRLSLNNIILKFFSNLKIKLTFLQVFCCFF